jgi:hypothetical protein
MFVKNKQKTNVDFLGPSCPHWLFLAPLGPSCLPLAPEIIIIIPRHDLRPKYVSESTPPLCPARQGGGLEGKLPTGS